MIGRLIRGEPAVGVPLYVNDADATYRRALQAGATSLTEPATQFYGDRSAGVQDPTGNFWWIATHVEDISPEEMQRRAEAQGEAVQDLYDRLQGRSAAGERS